MIGRQRGRQHPRIAMLAGWLFADLFLVLFMVALSAQPSTSLAAHVHQGKISQTVQKKHGSGTKKSSQPGVASTPVNICVSQSDASLVDGFDSQLKLQGLAGRRAGFILVFATGPDTDSAVTQATAAFELIKNTDPDRAAFAQAGGEGLWGGDSDSCAINGGTDNYHFQIFFYL
jgi:hypothetical protein